MENHITPILSTRESSSSSEFQLRLGGDLHQIEAATLITVLQSFVAITDTLVTEYDPGSRAVLKVSPPKRGSFQIKLQLDQVNVTLDGLQATMSTAPIEAAGGIAAIIGLLLYIRKQVANRKPIKIEETEQGVSVMAAFKSPITVNKTVYNILNNNQEVHFHLDNALTAVHKEPKLKSLEVRDANGKSVVRATKKQLDKMATWKPAANHIFDRKTELEQCWLSIVKPSFDPNLKWDFVYRGNRISATVEDPHFNQSVDAAKESFAKGHHLEVKLQILQEFDHQLGAYINKSYRVVKVFQHTGKPEQQALSE